MGQVEVLLALSWTRIISFVFISLPFITYCCWIFWKDRNKLYVQKRRPIVAVSIIILITITSFFFNFLDTTSCAFAYCRNISMEVTFSLLNCLVGPGVILISTRVWFLYYDLKYSQSVLTHKWWITISENDNTNWFIQNRSKYGTLSNFMYILITTLSFIYIMLTIIGISSFIPLYDATAAITAISGITFIVLLYCKMPKYYDVFLVRKEINRICITTLFVDLWFISTTTSGLDHNYNVLHWMHGFVMIFESMLFAAMLTLWPHFDNSLNTRKSEHTLMKLNSTNIETWIFYVNQNGDRNLNDFMRLLTREFAVENICFILETIQFKTQFISNINYEKLFENDVVQTNNDEIGWLIKLPHSLPKSSIIEDNIDDFKVQINQIYDKYIDDNAKFQVNISYQTKSKFVNDMKEVNEMKQNMKVTQLQLIPSNESNEENDKSNEIMVKILKIFDNALHEINENLTCAFLRMQMDQTGVDKQDIIDVIVDQTATT